MLRYSMSNFSNGDDFGQDGKVLKVSISRTAAGAIQHFANNTCSVACFGTTKYCHAWLRNVSCSNPDCLYLHEIGTQEDSFTKDGIISAYTRCLELVSVLVDMIFKTLCIYDDRGSRKAVDDVITKALGEVTFMKSFAATVVQVMEKQIKLMSHVGCYRLLKWSCLLLSKSQFASVSKNVFYRVAAVQASLLYIVIQGSFRERRACKRTFFRLFSEDARNPYKGSSELLGLLLEFSSSIPSLFDQWK
ncbi:Protein ILITYHIA, partial [Camellia lanceoleosa]